MTLGPVKTEKVEIQTYQKGMTIMKKKYKLQDLDCANCAAKMEEGIRKIPGVEEVSISFMTQKMTIVAADDKFDEIMKQAAEVCKKIEPDCKILL